MIAKKMIRKILPFLAQVAILGVALIFSACGGIGGNYPDWYLDNDEDSSYLYGVGDGETLNMAKSAALNDLCSQISTRIESVVTIEQSQIDERQSTRADSKIDLSVLDIQLDSIEYILQEEIEGHFFVKARIEKAKIISQINNDIDNINIDVNSILGEIKAMKCATISPQNKRTLIRLYNKALRKANQVYALDGKVTSQKTLDGVRTVVSQPSRAYYSAFANGGKKGDYAKINSGLTAEYKKFFSLEAQGKDKFVIENEYGISIGKDSLIRITLNASIKDCVGNTIFDTSLVGKDSTYAGALNRLKVQLYKKLKVWQDS